jgi:hypothetical protein
MSFSAFAQGDQPIAQRFPAMVNRRWLSVQAAGQYELFACSAGQTEALQPGTI